MNEGQKVFKITVRKFINGDTKAFVFKTRYGSGITTFMQRLIKNHNPEQVLFITYRQTLALDIMRNFGKLQIKNYLDACNDHSIWDAPRLNIQLDSLLNIRLKDGPVMTDDDFDLRYDTIVLDNSESLMNNFDEGAMNHKN